MRRGLAAKGGPAPEPLYNEPRRCLPMKGAATAHSIRNTKQNPTTTLVTGVFHFAGMGVRPIPTATTPLTTCQYQGFVPDKYRRINARPAATAYAKTAHVVEDMPGSFRPSHSIAGIQIATPCFEIYGSVYPATGCRAGSCTFHTAVKEMRAVSRRAWIGL